jgi:hypothetical protein
MPKIVPVPAQSIINLANSPSASRIEAERIRDVMILVTSLIEREEVTIKLIIDCLYDIGSMNLIDRKVRWRPLGSIAKLIARTSKPLLRIFAWRWFKRNCPQLITNWLYTKVKSIG